MVIAKYHPWLPRTCGDVPYQWLSYRNPADSRNRDRSLVTLACVHYLRTMVTIRQPRLREVGDWIFDGHGYETVRDGHGYPDDMTLANSFILYTALFLCKKYALTFYFNHNIKRLSLLFRKPNCNSLIQCKRILHKNNYASMNMIHKCFRNKVVNKVHVTSKWWK